MSIDAKISGVVRQSSDGSGWFTLIDRPATSPGESAGIAGQGALSFAASPESIIRLSGLNIWGSAEAIILGEVVIADRISHARIRFRHADVIDHALEQLFGGKVILTGLIEDEKPVSAQPREMEFWFKDRPTQVDTVTAITVEDLSRDDCFRIPDEKIDFVQTINSSLFGGEPMKPEEESTCYFAQDDRVLRDIEVAMEVVDEDLAELDRQEMGGES
jgi:hypothetical protein